MKHAALIDDFYQFYCIRSLVVVNGDERLLGGEVGGGRDRVMVTLNSYIGLPHFSVKLITRLDNL